jgi:hypothetical protein
MSVKFVFPLLHMSFAHCFIKNVMFSAGARGKASLGKSFRRTPTPTPCDRLQNNQSKMDWRCGPSGRAPALQVWNPEFKSQSHKKCMVLTHLWSFLHARNMNSSLVMCVANTFSQDGPVSSLSEILCGTCL